MESERKKKLNAEERARAYAETVYPPSPDAEPMVQALRNAIVQGYLEAEREHQASEEEGDGVTLTYAGYHDVWDAQKQKWVTRRRVGRPGGH